MSDFFSNSFNNRKTRGFVSIATQSQPLSILSKCYCYRCKRFCAHESALHQHIRDSPRHNVCDVCQGDMDFKSLKDLKAHYVRSKAHAYCGQCDEHFAAHRLFDEHLSFIHDARRGMSESTERVDEDAAVLQNGRQSYHYCAECNRTFQSANNLDAHRRSATHQPKNVRCPCEGCAQSFVSRSALILHLEYGICRSGVTFTSINKYVRQFDTECFITDRTRMVDGTEDVTVNEGWNGVAYECHLCHSLFHKRYSLIQHMRSPRHQTKIYVCPQSTCRERFSAFSGLCQHIESGKCRVKQDQGVQTFVDRLVRRIGSMTM